MTIAEYNHAVDQHADGIYRFALKHLRDEDRAKDVVQESFARLWVKVVEVDAQGGTAPCGFASWPPGHRLLRAPGSRHVG